jgi:hypothetical protein
MLIECPQRVRPLDLFLSHNVACLARSSTMRPKFVLLRDIKPKSRLTTRTMVSGRSKIAMKALQPSS